MDYTLLPEERVYLREIAKKQKEIANMQSNLDKIPLWYNHNDGILERPLVTIDETSFYDVIKPANVCTTEFGKFIETTIMKELTAYELIDDDRVFSDVFEIGPRMPGVEFGVKRERITKKDENGNNLGFHDIPLIVDLEEDLSKLSHTIRTNKVDESREIADAVEEVIGDILNVRIENNSMLWYPMITAKIVGLMGMQEYFYAMYDDPDLLKELTQFITDDIMGYAKWQESEGLLTANYGNREAGSRSYGFTNKLPTTAPKNLDLRKGPTDVKLKDIWLNINSQETVGISREMFEEFALPFYQQVCSLYGGVYYGCCEPVDGIYTGCLDTIPNIRKLSTSHWCNVESLCEQIRGKGVVLSRKPFPNYLGADAVFSEEAYAEYLKSTFVAGHGINVEVVLRDIYTLMGDNTRLKRAVKLIREEGQRHWRP